MSIPSDAPVAWRTLVDHRDADPPTRDVRHTLTALTLTLLDCARMLAADLRGELSDEALARRIRGWADHMIHAARSSVDVAGEHHLPDGKCVLLSNHTSLMDAPVALIAFPRRLVFVAKQELEAVPVFGSALARAGVVFVDRSHPRKAIAQLAEAREAMTDHDAVWIAVEGRRSPDGSLGRFKKGAFHFARQWKAPIVPTWIEGTQAIVDAGSWSSTTGQRCRVVFGPPVATKGAGSRDVPRLMDTTRERLEALAEIARA